MQAKGEGIMRYSCHNYFGHRVGLEGMILFDTMFRTSLWTCLFVLKHNQGQHTNTLFHLHQGVDKGPVQDLKYQKAEYPVQGEK